MSHENELIEQIYNCRTKLRGSHEQEYQNYAECAKSLGWKVKTYEEWLNS